MDDYGGTCGPWTPAEDAERATAPQREIAHLAVELPGALFAALSACPALSAALSAALLAACGSWKPAPGERLRTLARCTVLRLHARPWTAQQHYTVLARLLLRSKSGARMPRCSEVWNCGEKLNKDISFALRRGTIAQVTTHHALDGCAWLRPPSAPSSMMSPLPSTDEQADWDR